MLLLLQRTKSSRTLVVLHYNNGFSVNKITHYGPYRFDGCTKTGHGDPNNKAGHLSEKCHEFVGNNHCVTACR